LGPSSGVAVMPWNNNTTIQLFAVGSDGLMQNYSYSPSNASCASRGWCAPWSMPVGALQKLSPNSGVAVMPWNNSTTIQLFAVGSDGLMQNYSYNSTCTNGLYGWCAPWAMSLGGVAKLSTSTGVAVMPWNNNTTMQLFAVGSDGLRQNYSYSPSNASCTSRGWCAPWSMPEGSLPALSASSGVAAIPWYN